MTFLALISTQRSGSLASARSMTARAVLLAAGLASPAFGQFRDWQAGNGVWSSNFSWSPIGVPAPGDIARIGFHANAANSTVTLDQSDTVGGLQVTDGMMLDLGGSQLIVNGATLISGSNSPGKAYYSSTIRVEPGLAASELQVQNVSIQQDGQLQVADGAVARVDGEATLDAAGRLQGEGAINFTSNGVRALNNNGRIEFLSGDLTLNQQGAARLDLDGTGGTGQIMMNWLADFMLTVNGTSLTDSFSGDMYFAAECSLDMNLDDPWEADAGSSIHAYASLGSYPQGMRLMGAPVTLSGAVDVLGDEALFRVVADSTIESTADFNVGEQSQLRFEGPTRLNGGTFHTFSGDMADGGVTFAGSTQWSGPVTIDGAARQNANASVLGATTIDAVEFDMDGGGGVSASTWNINNSLVVNAERIDQDGEFGHAGRFDGTFNISGGLLARLTLNTLEPSSYWWMAGTMNLTGDATLFPTRLAGSRMHVTGDLNIVSGRVLVDADVRIYELGDVNVGPASAIVRLNRNTIIYGGDFTGSGTIQNTANGTMSISDSLDFGQIGLVNSGDLTLSLTNILVSVDRFEQTSQGALNVSISGPAPGVEHDLVLVTDGPAQLDGALNVALPALGGVQFYPQAGDEFTIISADGGVNGTFDADPVTFVDDLTFQWAVDYHPFNVTLRLLSVSPACPGDTNGDGMVNGADVSVLLAQYGQNIEQWSGADLNGDGQVNGQDLSVLLANFGDVCGPTSASV